MLYYVCALPNKRVFPRNFSRMIQRRSRNGRGSMISRDGVSMTASIR